MIGWKKPMNKIHAKWYVYSVPNFFGENAFDARVDILPKTWRKKTTPLEHVCEKTTIQYEELHSYWKKNT